MTAGVHEYHGFARRQQLGDFFRYRLKSGVWNATVIFRGMLAYFDVKIGIVLVEPLLKRHTAAPLICTIEATVKRIEREFACPVGFSA